MMCLCVSLVCPAQALGFFILTVSLLWMLQHLMLTNSIPFNVAYLENTKEKQRKCKLIIKNSFYDLKYFTKNYA